MHFIYQINRLTTTKVDSTYFGLFSQQCKITLIRCSILGPLLFLIYINDLPRVSPLFNMVMYADDTTLYCNLSNNTNENDLNSELHKISEWLASNKLSLNAQKTKFMVFHSMQRKVKYPVLTINNTIIERVKQFNFLGIILHYTLKWQKHIDYISKKSI